MPGGWHEPQYWLNAAAWFSGTWLCAAIVARGIQWGSPRVRNLVDPAKLYMTAEAGEREAYVTIKCMSGQSTVRVDGRIVKTLDRSVNPAPHLFVCNIELRGNIARASVEIRKTEWAQIKLARMIDSRSDDHLVIDRGSEDAAWLPNAGALVEFRLYGTGLEIVKQYKVSIRERNRRNTYGTDPYLHVEEA